MASRHYRLQTIPGQLKVQESAPNLVQLGWQECMTIHYQVIPLEEESNTCLLSESSFSRIDVDPLIVECVESNVTNYLCLERAWENFEVSLGGSTGPTCAPLP